MTLKPDRPAVWTIRLLFGSAILLLVVLLTTICLDDPRYRSGRLMASVFAMTGDNLYVAPDPEEMFTYAWLGMKDVLDPYTNFIPASSYRYVDEENRGSFEGIGVEITVRDGLVTVISPIAGSHAEEIGLRSGDQVIAVDSVDVTDMAPDEVTSRIRGDAGTMVLIRIRRPGMPKPFEVEVERRRVDLTSVIYSGVVDSIGYIHLSRFSLTTAEEISLALDRLISRRVAGLIIDLRGNPGGFMSEAVYLAGLFLPKGSLILATKSRRGWENYSVRTSDDGPLLDIPLVLLVDHGSASASEIVAGTLQDYDRAVILGDTTFGKGLVQTNLMLEGGSALRVTTSKYYLPSGRLVQRFAERDWAKNMKVSRSELNTAYRTEGGRDVYGGGGVAPDMYIPPDTMSILATALSYQGLFFKFAVDYRAERGGTIPHHVDEDLIELFRQYVYEHGFEYPNMIEEGVSALENDLAVIESSQLDEVLRGMKSKAQLTEDAAWDSAKPYIRRRLQERFAGIRGGVEEIYVSSRLRHDSRIRAAVNILSDFDVYRSILMKQ